MALWPFGRKLRRADKATEQPAAAAPVKADLSEGMPSNLGQSATAAAASKFGRRLTRHNRPRSTSAASKAQSTQTREGASSDIPPVPSLPPPKAETADRLNAKTPATTTSAGPPRRPLAEANANRDEMPGYYYRQTASQTSLQAEHFAAMPSLPTLRGTRSHTDGPVPRHKSSKRKEEERARAKEIKAMSVPIPIPRRPTSRTGGLLARESRKVPGGLNRHFERPMSDISLPTAESLLSSHSSQSDLNTQSFKVSAFDALSPRPTIKCAENPRWQGGRGGPSRTSIRKDKGPVIPEEGFDSSERIEGLADELDASGLRELLDRDQRRRERKRKSNHAELQRKLQRKSEKQRAEEEAREGAATAAGEEREGATATAAEEADGNEKLPRDTSWLENNAAAGEQSKGHVPERKPSWLDDASKEHLPVAPAPAPETAAESYLDDASVDGRDSPVVATATAVRLSQAGVSPPSSPVLKEHSRGPSNLSTLVDLPRPDDAEPPESQEPVRPEGPGRLKPGDARRDSDTSGRVVGSWTSFFRRSGPRGKRDSSDRGRAEPSQFSNTSRESFARQAPPPTLPAARSYRPRSGTPVRTQSKFREDLPELPMSPPASRVQSPELRNSPYIDRASKIPAVAAGGLGLTAPLSDVHPAYRDEVAASRGQSLRGPSPDVPSPNLLSQSLASVDSEASWLSGRPPKRSSAQANPFRSSTGSLSQHLQERSQEEEAEGSADAYFARRDPAAGTVRARGGLSAQLHADHAVAAEDSGNDDDGTTPSPPEEAVRVNTVIGRHPTIIRRHEGEKSKEGLLDDFLDTEDSPTSPGSPGSHGSHGSRTEEPGRKGGPERTSVHRATSVEYGKQGHARHMSAGSARLLDVTPRSSREQSRLGSVSAEKSPLSDSNTADAD